MRKPPSRKRKPLSGYLPAVKLIQIAGYDRRLGDAARRILMIYQGYAGAGGECWVSQKTVAENLNMSRQAISCQINALKKAGYLTSVPRYKEDKGQISNLTILNLKLAHQYAECPEKFSQSDSGLWISGEELLPPQQNPKLTSPATPRACTKTTTEENHKKKGVGIQKSLKKANDWQAEKSYEEKTGITKSNIVKLQQASDNLKRVIGNHRFVEYEVSLNGKLKGYSRLQAVRIQTKAYQRKARALINYQSQSKKS